MLNKVAQSYQITFDVLQNVQLSESGRKLIDAVNFALGFIGISNLIKIHYFENREIHEVYDRLPSWQQTALTIADYLGSLSLILGALKSQPTIAIVKWSIQKILSPEQLLNMFLRNALYDGKVYKVMGLLSILLGIPATIKTFYTIYLWVNHRRSLLLEEQEEHFYTPLPINKSTKVDSMMQEWKSRLLLSSPDS